MVLFSKPSSNCFNEVKTSFCEFLLCCLNSQFDVQLIQKNYDLRTGAFPLTNHVTASSVTSATFLHAVPLLPVPDEAAIAITAKGQQQSGKAQ